MVEAVRSHSLAKRKTGRPGKLSLEDQLLMTLEYGREDRTYFYIGQSWGVNESTADRLIRKIEDTLTKSRAFTLPGKKRLCAPDYQLEIVVIDVTQTASERPKKHKNSWAVGKRKDTHSSLK